MATHDQQRDEPIQREQLGPAPEDTSTRRLLVLVLDMSWSMGQKPSGAAMTPIAELNASLKKYLDGLRNGTSPFRLNGELAICAVVHSDAKFMVPGTPVRPGSAFFWARFGADAFPSELPASGNTPLGKAVDMCLELIAERLLEHEEDGVELVHRPVLLVLTDGKPTDDISRAVRRAHQMESDGDLLIWIAAMKDADMQALVPLANKGNFVPLGTRAIDSFIQLMSASMRAAEAGRRRSAEDIYKTLNAKIGLQS